jgi:hypothetical protein
VCPGPSAWHILGWLHEALSPTILATEQSGHDHDGSATNIRPPFGIGTDGKLTALAAVGGNSAERRHRDSGSVRPDYAISANKKRRRGHAKSRGLFAFSPSSARRFVVDCV